MSKKFLYVSGDSFCFHRNDPSAHWPARLAELLNLSLEGEGFPGQSWWPTRKNFNDYILTEKFNDTNVFIFCHTDIYRPLTSNKIWSHGYTQEMLDFHTKYILDYQVNDWTSSNWYGEINQAIKDKLVIHLHCFDSNKHIRSMLHGLHVETELIKLSRFNHKNSINKMNHSDNHFTQRGNYLFADFLYQCITTGNAFLDPIKFQEEVYK